jgi:hypothetical protein
MKLKRWVPLMNACFPMVLWALPGLVVGYSFILRSPWPMQSMVNATKPFRAWPMLRRWTLGLDFPLVE